MSRRLAIALSFGFLIVASTAPAADIRGDYLETRTCDVYTGPCFANAQMGLTGNQAILAWRVEEGILDDCDLAGLSVVLCVSGDQTLDSRDAVATAARCVALVDERADSRQRAALVRLAASRAGRHAQDVARIDAVSIVLDIDHTTMTATLAAGDDVRIVTRKLAGSDCVCSNEIVYYPPLTEVENFEPAYAVESTFSGRGLHATWSNPRTRSAFLATFGY